MTESLLIFQSYFCFSQFEIPRVIFNKCKRVSRINVKFQSHFFFGFSFLSTPLYIKLTAQYKHKNQVDLSTTALTVLFSGSDNCLTSFASHLSSRPLRQPLQPPSLEFAILYRRIALSVRLSSSNFSSNTFSLSSTRWPKAWAAVRSFFRILICV